MNSGAVETPDEWESLIGEATAIEAARGETADEQIAFRRHVADELWLMKE